MKYLVLGCNGMAGHIISIYLKESGHDVTGFARRKSPFIDTICGNALDLQLLNKIIKSNTYDSIINCIGILNQFAEEKKAEAVFLNSYLPHFLADITSGTRTQVIQMSTDCVFSGKKGNYTEDSLRDGETFYDRSKALGELEDDKNITLRNSIVGPDINMNGIGLLNWFMKQNNTVYGYQKAIWTGQTTLQLAKTIEYAAKERCSGLVNAVPDSSITKYDLLILFNKYIRNNSITILPSNSVAINKSLVRTRFKNYPFTIPDYEIMIKELSGWMRIHKSIYPHYEL